MDEFATGPVGIGIEIAALVNWFKDRAWFSV